ncbi:cytochrome P450 28L1 [Ceratitis capitata]|uniref:Putative cytochrome P450 28d1 n=1 Tax=Ceratitis capitata TaxID=7213 RepID=W8C6B3_CERCA|nr:cytochrome P450 28L1 [Ceratitis capitata]
MFSLILILLIATITMIYLFLIWNFTYWRIRGVIGPSPVPFFGSFPGLIMKNKHFADDINSIYRKYNKCESYVGVFLLRSPKLMILDPKLVHDIFVTSFKNFNSNDIAKLIDKNKDVLLGNNPFILSGKEWREQRAMVSPGVTISRLRTVYYIMQSVSKSWCEYLKRQMEMEHSANGLNGKDIALRFTSANIAKSVLGFTSTDPIKPLVENIKMLSENNNSFIIYSIMAGLFPQIVKIFKAKFIPRKCEEFFKKLILDAFKICSKRSKSHHDFMDYILSIKENHNLNDKDLISYTMTLLIEGLDTSATVLSHCLFLLGRYQTVQKKLFNEVISNSKNGELSFESINQLPYLDACVYESIRIFPPGLWSIKTCTMPYTFTNKRGEQVSLDVGDSVMIPIYALHHDAKYYPNPDQFKPERFLIENINKLKMLRHFGAFLGFGDGPRMCLGINFAMIQAKTAIVSILRQFKIDLSDKCTPFVKLDPKSFLTQQDGGVWLDFQDRN